eukprot:4207686-Heterocapsa_arctica.AAC.1
MGSSDHLATGHYVVASGGQQHDQVLVLLVAEAAAAAAADRCALQGLVAAPKKDAARPGSQPGPGRGQVARGPPPWARRPVGQAAAGR